MGIGSGKLYSHWQEVPEFVWEVCENFHPRTDPKLVSPDTGAFRVHLPSMVSLQRLRNEVGPIHLLSGYRSPLYNSRLRGSSPVSMHTYLLAFDLVIGDRDPAEFEKIARAVGFTGIGRYPSRGFMHVDQGRSRHWYGSRKDKQIWQSLTNG